ncbi:TetR/AcrR family transcriptional regulator [Amnibacterium flavum]|uniref:TetR/AcrR family transcriptional regulator n=1 Tax=Amnibacterium flavum TaxID=2173173 RepID=A0A2V1HNR3_9MICO|nr:TetR family transcriptional regulator [Amnibacterium flavum]PVZ94198.1 TetR/AcrR family transcriptional regulator [Amnibacterium flavum]
MTIANPASRDGQPRGPYKRGIERRRQVVVTATDVFGEFGFRGGTLQQVADRVGGTPAAILKLFGSKERLLIAVLDHWGSVTGEIVARGTEERAFLDGFVELMNYHVNHKGLLQLYTTMAAEASTPQHPAHEFMTNRYRRTLESMRNGFRAASEGGHFRRLSEKQIAHEAEYLLAILDGLEIQFILNPAFDLETSFAAYVDTVYERLAV